MSNTSCRILITADCEAHWLKRLQGISSSIQVEQWPSIRAIPAELWHAIEILYTSFATPLPSPEQVPRLRWIQLYSAGPDPIVGHPLFQTSVMFTTTSGVHAISVAEYVFTMILAWFHRMPHIYTWQQRNQWPSRENRSSLFIAEELQGKTIGIVGYGSIGRQVACLAHAFGMRVLAMQRTADHRDSSFPFPGIGDPEGMLPRRYYIPEQLRSMLAESDIVVLTVPLTSKTRGLFGDTAFQAMKPTAFFVNVARGDVCDEAALVRALHEQRIAGAALDVFHQEPLPSDHPLWHLSNVLISPHIAGFSLQYPERAAMVFEENLRRYVAGEPLYNIVDKKQEY